MSLQYRDERQEVLLHPTSVRIGDSGKNGAQKCRERDKGVSYEMSQMYGNFPCRINFFWWKKNLYLVLIPIGYPWLRLIKSKEKSPLISYNPEYIQEADHIEKKTYDSKKNHFYTCTLTKCSDVICKWTKMNFKSSISLSLLINTFSLVL